MNRIDLHQFAIVTQGLELKDVKEIKYMLHFQSFPDTYNIGASARFEFSGQDKALAAVAEVGCLFSIRQDDWDREIQSAGAVPKWILNLFAVHTVGTARGLVYAKTEDTPLKGLIIPPVNVDQMIAGDLPLKPVKQETAG